MKILLIGWNTLPAQEYVQRLQAIGHDVFWVGQDTTMEDKMRMQGEINQAFVDDDIPRARALITILFESMKIKPDLSIEHCKPGFLYAQDGWMGKVTVPYTRMYLEKLLDIVGDDFDVILQIQNWLEFQDEDKSPIPFVYYCTEPFHARIPKCAHHVLAPGIKMTTKLHEIHGNEYKSYKYLPFAARAGMIYEFQKYAPENAFLDENRPVSVCFAGKIYGFDFYQDRARTILDLESRFNGQFEGHWTSPPDDMEKQIYTKPPKAERGRGGLNIPMYVQMLLRSKFGINYPTEWGCNFRDFEVPAAGAILLTRYNMDFEGLGFKDGVNCITYKTVDEAEEIIKRGYDPDIALAGFSLVHGNHTYGHRMKRLQQYLEEIT